MKLGLPTVLLGPLPPPRLSLPPQLLLLSSIISSQLSMPGNPSSAAASLARPSTHPSVSTPAAAALALHLSCIILEPPLGPGSGCGRGRGGDTCGGTHSTARPPTLAGIGVCCCLMCGSQAGCKLAPTQSGMHFPAAGNTLRQLIFDSVMDGSLVLPPPGAPHPRPSAARQALATAASFAVSGLVHEGIFL